MGKLHQDKLRIAQDILKEMGIPIWLIYSKEDSDKTFKRLVSGEAMAGSFLVMSPTNKRVIVSSLDANNLSGEELGEKNIIVYSKEGDKEALTSALKDFGFPDTAKTIAVNYSTGRDPRVDRLGSGMRDWIDDFVIETFFSEGLSEATSIRDIVVSAEDILYPLYDRKTPEEIERMKIAVRRSNEILKETFSQLKAGMKDWDVYKLIHEIVKEGPRPSYLSQAGVESQDLGWSKGHCPVVLTGKSFTKGGHAVTCGETIEPGNTVYIDFGVKLTWKDGISYCGDIQRMGYVLREGETEASSHAIEIFNILNKAVTKGIEFIRPGVCGYEVDEVVRDVINQAGHDYDHGTGHPLGEEVHGVGTVLNIRKEDGPPGAESLKVQESSVVTIEPRIPIVNGGSIEEDVWVKPDGNETLCPRQDKLYLIPCK